MQVRAVVGAEGIVIGAEGTVIGAGWCTGWCTLLLHPAGCTWAGVGYLICYKGTAWVPYHTQQ